MSGSSVVNVNPLAYSYNVSRPHKTTVLNSAQEAIFVKTKPIGSDYETSHMLIHDKRDNSLRASCGPSHLDQVDACDLAVSAVANWKNLTNR